MVFYYNLNLLYMNQIIDRDKFQEQWEKTLKETIFPQDKVHEDVIGVSFALFHCKPIADIGATGQILEEIYKAIAEEKISLFQMSFIINSLGKCSAKDLGIDTKEYIRILKLNDEMGEVWNEISRPAKNKLVEKLNREVSKGVKHPNNVNPQNRKR